MRNKPKGTRALSTDIAEDIRAYLDYHAKSRGESLRVIVERALLADFQGAPPLPVPPPIPEDAPKPRRKTK